MFARSSAGILIVVVVGIVAEGGGVSVGAFDVGCSEGLGVGFLVRLDGFLVGIGVVMVVGLNEFFPVLEPLLALLLSFVLPVLGVNEIEIVVGLLLVETVRTAVIFEDLLLGPSSFLPLFDSLTFFDVLLAVGFSVDLEVGAFVGKYIGRYVGMYEGKYVGVTVREIMIDSL